MHVARTDAARDAAASVRFRLGLGSGYVDAFEALRRLGIELYTAPFPNDALDGAHLVRDGSAFVFVNTAHAITRQRLTAAHELGHHILDDPPDGSAVYDGDTSLDPGNDPAEHAAYRFARFLLMDPDGVSRLVGEMTDEREKVAAVASTFVVSPEVAAIHLIELGLISATTKRQLTMELSSRQTTPSALLKRYGYRMAWTPTDAGPELDPGHKKRTIDAYRKEWITLASFADAMQLPESEARELLVELGLPIREPKE